MEDQYIKKLPIVFEADYPLENESFVHFSAFSIKSSSPDRLHYHKSVEIGRCVHGLGNCYVNNSIQSFHASDIQIILPFQPHLSVKADDVDRTLWHFVSFDPLAISTQNIRPSPNFIPHLIRDHITANGIFQANEYPLLTALVNDIIDTAYGHSSFKYELLTAQILHLFVLLAEISQNRDFAPYILNNGNFRSVVPAIELVSRSIYSHQPVSVTQMAKECNMSESYFRKVFTAAVGRSPKNFIDYSILTIAAHLLVTSDIPVTSVAPEIGLEDNSTFYRKFIKYYGMSPSEYRRRSNNYNHR